MNDSFEAVVVSRDELIDLAMRLRLLLRSQLCEELVRRYARNASRTLLQLSELSGGHWSAIGVPLDVVLVCMEQDLDALVEKKGKRK